MLANYFAEHPLTEVRYAPLFPSASDRAAWAGVDPADRADLLALAEGWRGKPYPILTAGMYAAFVRTGSRTDCQGPYFARRRKLISAALHVCLTGADDLLPDVEDGLFLLCEETTWAISAHAHLNADHPFPDDQATIVDLFAAQTGMILSFTAELLGERIHPDLMDRVRRAVERRILRPFMENDNEGWMGFVQKNLGNWTPWIVSNVLMTANTWHFGGAALVVRACGMIDRWLACVPEDGGCDEGAAYWNMAGGAFADCLMYLEAMAGVDLWQNEKVRRMMAYPELVYLGNGWFANFADCDARPYISGERIQYAGAKTGSASLVRMGAEMRREPSYELSDTPHLSRLLMRLFSKPAETETADVRPKDVWLPDLQVRLVQQGRMTVAMKGGHNAENHNHNDVGSFLIMADGDMQVVDAGNMVYTAKTFSNRRYELWNCRAAYHNVPIIADCEQQPGRAFAARDVVCLPDGMELDLAGAYPAEAGVMKCRRKMRVRTDRLTIREEITLEAEQPVTWVFMLRHRPEILQEKGALMLDTGFAMSWADNKELTCRVEELPVTDGRMKNNYPGSLWRLTLTAPHRKQHNVKFWFEV